VTEDEFKRICQENGFEVTRPGYWHFTVMSSWGAKRHFHISGILDCRFTPELLEKFLFNWTFKYAFPEQY
jgi:hypothetical protein